MNFVGPAEIVRLLDKAFNEGDVEAVLGFYDDDAVVVIEPGKIARGRVELREFFERVIAAGVSARQVKTHVIEADGVALFLSRWILMVKNPDGSPNEQQFTATSVFRRTAEGNWKALIDNSLGPLVLDAQ